MSEMMEVEDYPRDRSRSPARENNQRERSRSPRRDYGDRRERGGFRSRGPPREYGGRPQFQRRQMDRPGEYEAKANRKYENSIFIGNLPYNVQWYEIKDHFASAGPIVRADVVTSHGRSKGMGTVEFENREIAQNAINLFDRTEFKGREIFVREDLPPPEKKSNDFRQPERFDRNDRYGGDNEYDRYGPPRGEYDRYGPPRGEYDRYGPPRGGYDRYGPPRGDYDRYDRYGPPARGGYDRYDRYAPPRDSYAPRSDYTARQQTKGYEVFIGNLPYSVKWQQLKDLFREFGSIERADVLENSYGRSKGMGTVYFTKLEDAENAIAKLNGYDWDGRIIEVRKSKFPRNEDIPPVAEKIIKSVGLSKNTDFTLGVTGNGNESNILYIGNLPWETAESDLFELFGSVSTVEKAELQYGRGGNSSGNAIVQFPDVESAQNVIKQLDGYEYGNRRLKISFANYPTPEKLAELHEEIQKSLSQANFDADITGAPISDAVQPEDQQPAESQPLIDNPVEIIDDGDDMIEE